jgi:hypothetical protein
MHGIVYICMVFPLYMLLSQLTSNIALRNPTHHDVVYIYSEYAVYAIPVILFFSIGAAAVTKPDYDILFKRLALMFALKGIIQFATITPQPAGVEECIGSTFWEFKNCADMMFSGHTAFVYLLLYKCRYRYFITFTMAYQLVMAKWHYIADCLVAIIVGYAIEKKIIIQSYI